jgi:hypothetical protein
MPAHAVPDAEASPHVVVDLDPWRPSGGDPWDKRKAAHLMRRAGFGAKPEELDLLATINFDRVLDVLLSPDRSTLPEFGVRVLPNGEVLDLSNDVDSQRAYWIWEAVHTPYPLREKMALFWHDHFSVGTKTGGGDYLMVHHVNLFRRFGLTNFRDVLIEVTRDPAMLLWLDNWVNGQADEYGVGRINENYARELLELYSLGIGNYSQTDVVEAAKCLSGWSLRSGYGSNEFVYRPEYHVPGPKYVLGRTIDNGTNGYQDTFDLIDAILAQPAAAEFIVRKLWKYFVSDDAPLEIIRELATRFRNDGYQLRPLMSTMFRSRFFFSDRAIRRLVKNPMEFAVGAIRNLGVPLLLSYQEAGIHVADLGLPLLRYQSPAGLADGLAWLGSQAVLRRANFAEELTRKSNEFRMRAHFDPFREIVRVGLNSADAIVRFYLDLLLDGDYPPLLYVLCMEFMNRNDRGIDWFSMQPLRVDKKLRGLVHAIMSLPEYSAN